ncbi:MAG: aldo/keto reductase [Bacillota bacterium]
MSIIKETLELANGIRIPKIGYGTWQLFEGEHEKEIFKTAIRKGYRLIDTAAMYDNEVSVGRAIKESKVPRDELFVTSKLMFDVKTYDGALEAFESTMRQLDLDYLDLYLIHAPAPIGESGAKYDNANITVWKAFEKLYEEGRIKAIGVSNFNERELTNLIEHTDIVPHVNQIPFHIGLDQESLLEFCTQKGILVEAYSPLDKGKVLKNKLVNDMAGKYGKTPAQMALRYIVERGVVPIPKTANPKRMDENKALDFTLEEADIEKLKTL